MVKFLLGGGVVVIYMYPYNVNSLAKMTFLYPYNANNIQKCTRTMVMRVDMPRKGYTQVTVPDDLKSL